MRLKCPHCDAWARVRSSQRLNRCTTELFLQCMNLECGHTFAASVQASRTLSPSAMPNPSVTLPFSPHVKRRAPLAPAAGPHPCS